MVQAGLKAIYMSGWQVAGDNNTAGETYPDQSLYPSNSCPELVRRINKALQRADQIHHAEGKKDTVFSARKARQAASHPDWLREHLKLPESTEIIPIVITPCTKSSKGALPVLKKVRYWSRDDFRTWAKNALRAIRDIRRDFPGVGNLAWRTAAAARLKAEKITPEQLKGMLSKSAADVMRGVEADQEES